MQCKYICNWPIGLSGHAPAAAPSSSCRQFPNRKTFGCVTVNGAEHRECSPALQPRSSRRRPSPRRPRSSCEPPDLRIGRGCSDRRGVRPRHSGAARVAGTAPAPERKGAGRERRAAAADFLTRASAGIRNSGFPRSLLAFPSRHIPPAPAAALVEGSSGAGRRTCGQMRQRLRGCTQSPFHPTSVRSVPERPIPPASNAHKRPACPPSKGSPKWNIALKSIPDGHLATIPGCNHPLLRHPPRIAESHGTGTAGFRQSLPDRAVNCRNPRPTNNLQPRAGKHC